MVYWIWLTTRKGLRRSTVRQLLEYFETAEDIYFAGDGEYRLAGVGEAERQALAQKDLEEAREILRRCGEADIHVASCRDAQYPNRLRNIPDPPVLLYYTGVLPPVDDAPLVAVVGSRRSSAYGLSCAKRLGFQIAMCGGIVVSGLALGGDAMAMVGAVSARKPVVGVLGCGVDVVYPRQNRHLYEDVRRVGCLISEYPPGTPPRKGHFPARNRILSGLSVGVVVVEAPAKSGALITASQALEQGRDLFAVPGNIGVPACAGSNRLLKEGAYLVESGWDVMQMYQALYPGRVTEYREGQRLEASPGELRTYGRAPEAAPQLVAEPPPEGPEPAEKPASADKKSVDNPAPGGYIDVQAVLDTVSPDERAILLQLETPRHVDQLAEACAMTAGRVLASLTLLEIKQYITRLPGNRYQLRRRDSK